MKLKRVKFNNFRLLKNLELTFSSDNEHNLTVIRAANESGKTTIMHGIMWALYGDQALPSTDYRTYPIDYQTLGFESSDAITTSVEVDYQVEILQRYSDEVAIDTYRVVRQVIDSPNNDQVRNKSTVSLFRFQSQNQGLIEEPAPDSIIHDHLREELKDIFFTDGDSALAFLDNPSEALKRKKVEKAIKSLLDVDVIQSALAHVKKSRSETNSKVAQEITDGMLSKLAKELEKDRAELEKLEEKETELESIIEDYSTRFVKAEKKLLDTLKQGGGAKRELSHSLERALTDQKKLENDRDKLTADHKALFAGHIATLALLSPITEKAYARLSELRDEGQIPNETVPVLKDRLKSMLCICGESLDPLNEDATNRIHYIHNLIQESQGVDETKRVLGDLYVSAAERFDVPSTALKAKWGSEHRNIITRYELHKKASEEISRKIKSYQKSLSELEDVDLEELENNKSELLKAKESHSESFLETKVDIQTLKKTISNSKTNYDALFKVNQQNDKLKAAVTINDDVIYILESTLERLTGDELTSVSENMNELFLNMIGSDPETGSIIEKANIAEDFSIKVYGSNDKTLNPSTELNGASRRCLTIAFILALTNGSGVIAPNVIDTPLAMMSGYVKESTLTTLVQEGSQVILFLTHDELMGIEDSIDRMAGEVYTLTNSSHYPSLLVNQPQVDGAMTIRCECNHRSFCEICERKPLGDLV